MPEDLQFKLSHSSETERAKESLKIVKRSIEAYGVIPSHGL